MSRSLAKLEELGLLETLGGNRFRLFRMRDTQLDFLADKKFWSGNASADPDEFVDDFAPVREAAASEQEARGEVSRHLKTFPINEKQVRQIYHAVVSRPDWRKDWKEMASRLINEALGSA